MPPLKLVSPVVLFINFPKFEQCSLSNIVTLAFLEISSNLSIKYVIIVIVISNKSEALDDAIRPNHFIKGCSDRGIHSDSF